MAGITSTSGSSCFPLLTRITATKMTPYILSLSAIRAPIPHFSQIHHHLPLRWSTVLRSATVRLIDQQQNMVGVVPVREAIQMAEDAELDLVIVFTRCRPSGSQDNGLQGIECLLSIVEPVPLYLVVLLPNAICLIQWLHFDLKFRYEPQKKKREQQKKSAGVLASWYCERYDTANKISALSMHMLSLHLRWHQKKVKVIVNLNWRENEFRNIAIELIRRIQNFVGELATEESKNFHDRNIFISLVPNKAILQKALEPPKKKNKSAANEVSAGMSACKFTRGFNYGTLGPDHILLKEWKEGDWWTNLLSSNWYFQDAFAIPENKARNACGSFGHLADIDKDCSRTRPLSRPFPLLNMEASAGLVAGSHNRNELVVIHGHEEHKPLKNLDGQVCEICGDEIGLTVDGDLFVACNECGFPACRPCYEYERREGSQNCPQCKTRYKRLKGSPRVEGDDDEDDLDDIEHEFIIEDEQDKNKYLTEAMLHGKMTYGRGHDDEENSHFPPVITGIRSRPVSGEFPIGSHGEQMLPSSLHKRVHPYPVSEPGSARWDAKKEGGWKERMDDWKMQQGNLGPEQEDDAEAAMLDEARQPLSRKVPIASSKINPYRMVIVARLIILAFFLRYRILHPVHDAIGLWLTSIVCEIWFAISWILDQFPKWLPIDRETYLDRLSLRRFLQRGGSCKMGHHGLETIPGITLINMKGLDGIQGPVYVGTGCVFKRQALYGYDPPKEPKRPKMVTCDCCPCFGRRKKKNAKNGAVGEGTSLQGMDNEKEQLMSQMNFEKRFGQSAIFVTSTLMEEGGVPPSSSPAALLKEAIHVISCGYEDKTEWGLEVVAARMTFSILFENSHDASLSSCSSLYVQNSIY
ncbi:hypothetical protein NC653_017012 [Populus alba x Populus x berolinensis]|uniref:Cellulose synthase n=1 Tax=Populus alba x Populus x berolinensis TaxID=444605 RepID=A0AAD6QPF1_9ROSI|nr:hypothetical protein NC653_017012 [Populus alba x Populus x berolinensis]